MQRLYIIGTTADKRRLLLAKNPGAKFGSYSAPIGPKMRRIIEELREEDVAREAARGNGGRSGRPSKTPARPAPRPADRDPEAVPSEARRGQAPGGAPAVRPRGDPLDVPLPGGARVVSRADAPVRPAPSRGGSIVDATVPPRKARPKAEVRADEAAEPGPPEQRAADAPQDEPRPPKAARKMPSLRSKLAPAEIQTLLRQGKGVKAVAAMASAPIEWVQRLMEPIALERAGIVDQMKRARFSKSRLGPSSAMVGDSIADNLRDRGVPAPEKVLQEGWRAHRPEGRPWRVTFTYKHRGSSHTARWAFDQASRSVTALNALASQLAWRSPPNGERNAKRSTKRAGRARTR